MPAADSPANGAFKEWFNADRYRTIADSLDAATKRFDRETFLELTLDGLTERSLMERLHQTTIAADASLTGSFAQKVKILEKITDANDHGFVGVWFAEFVGRFGRGDPALALPALRHFTRFGSAEFAIRNFIEDNCDATLSTMLSWTRDPSEHVRRLASEGSRPRLPWGRRLTAIVDNPALTRPILEALHTDDSLYVRKSVANHLNDITKDHPDYLLDMVESWDRSHPHTAWIVKQGLRSLIKKGDQRALSLIGAEAKPNISVETFTAAPDEITLGDRITLSASLQSIGKKTQRLVIDYAVNYVKANGQTTAKVFKWKQVDLAPSDRLSLERTQVIKDFTTRRHYAGVHRLDLQINGQRFAQTEFTLVIP